jgi:hypothetical protein
MLLHRFLKSLKQPENIFREPNALTTHMPLVDGYESRIDLKRGVALVCFFSIELAIAKATS